MDLTTESCLSRFEIDPKLDPLKVIKVYGYLEYMAVKKSVTHYSPVGAVVSLPAESFELWRILGACSRISADLRGVLLSAIVINATTGNPGKDFYPLLELVHRNSGDKLADWSAEVTAVFAAYKQ